MRQISSSEDSSSESSSETAETEVVGKRNKIQFALFSRQKEMAGTVNTSKTVNICISDLSGYKLIIARQLAVISLHALVSDFFTFRELMFLAKSRKATVWSKILEKVRPMIPNQNQKIQGSFFYRFYILGKGYFGAPLESQIENYGCTLNLGPQYVRNNRIPLFFRTLVAALLESGILTRI